MKKSKRLSLVLQPQQNLSLPCGTGEPVAGALVQRGAGAAALCRPALGEAGRLIPDHW